MSLGELSRGLHATPLDLAAGFFVPVAIHRSGATVSDSISVVSMVLAVIFMLGVWRLTLRLDMRKETRVGVALALVLSGLLQAFAGYAESTGLLLALAPWWWVEVLAPHGSRRQAARSVRRRPATESPAGSAASSSLSGSAASSWGRPA